MTTPFKSDYACGLHVNRVDGHSMIEHDGNNIGFNADMAYYPEERISPLSFSQTSMARSQARSGRDLQPWRSERPLRCHLYTRKSRCPSKFCTLSGTYQFPDYSLEMLPEGNHLLVKYDDGSDLPVFPESETRFFSKPWPIEFEFSKNDSGGLAVLIRHQTARSRRGRRSSHPDCLPGTWIAGLS